MRNDQNDRRRCDRQTTPPHGDPHSVSRLPQSIDAPVSGDSGFAGRESSARLAALALAKLRPQLQSADLGRKS
jgi:hypothetical protein